MNKMSWGGARKGAGRKPTGKNTVSVTLTLTKNEAEMLKNRAAFESMSVSRFIAKYLHLNLS